MDSLLVVKNLSKQFGHLGAVKNISFEVDKGSCFGLLGPNGAGKTTTLEMLEGLIKPSSGEIFFYGEPASKAMFERLGIQFQHTALQDYLTVRETLNLFSSFYSHTRERDNLVDLCGLGEFLDRDHRKLSGGQKQRLLLALALINDPELIFLDEPTTGLDPSARRDFWHLIDKVKAEGKTLVLTTHYMDEAQTLCDHIVIMDKGNIIEQGAPLALLQRHFQHALIRLPRKNFVNRARPALPMRESLDAIEISASQVDLAIQSLISAGISLEGLSVKSPTLDDLFLKLSGHQLRSEHEA